MKSKVGCVVVMCLLAAPAWGQTKAAIECETNAACVALYEQAQQQSKAGQLVEAEKSYKLAYEVSQDARLLFNIARVLDKRGQGPEAITYYRRFMAAPIEDPEQNEKARGYVAQLETKNDPASKRLTIEAASQATSKVVPVVPTAEKTESSERPVYKKGWFWGVMVGSVAAVGLGIGLGVGLSNQTATVPGGTNTIDSAF